MNSQIFHQLQTSLTNGSLLGLSVPFSSLSPPYQVFICKTHALLQLRKFWSTFWSELANESLYQASIDSMRFRLQELQETNFEAQELQSKEGYEKVKEIAHHWGLFFVPEAIWIKLISHHYNDLLASHFGTKKTCKLLAQKYFWPFLRHNVETYVKGCNMCLASKTVRHKPYNDL